MISGAVLSYQTEVISVLLTVSVESHHSIKTQAALIRTREMCRCRHVDFTGSSVAWSLSDSSALP